MNPKKSPSPKKEAPKVSSTTVQNQIKKPKKDMIKIAEMMKEESDDEYEVGHSKHKKMTKDAMDVARSIKSMGQKRTLDGFRKLPFQRLIKQTLVDLKILEKLAIGEDNMTEEDFQIDYKLTRGAQDALQLISELYLINLFEDSNMLCNHAGRVTLMQKDIRLARLIRGRVSDCYA